MVCCSVKGCKSYRKPKIESETTVQFHRFPSDFNLCKKWVEACNKKIVNTKNTRICSLHFDDESYSLKSKLLKVPVNKRKLNITAVPTLLLPVQETKKEDVERAALKEQCTSNPFESIMELASSSSNMNFKITLVDEKRLIELVEVSKCLYDTADENYGISKFVNDVWEEIGNQINVSPKQCTVIWMNLRNEYAKHFEKKGPNKVNDLLKHMHFLWPLYIKRFCNEVNFCASNIKHILDDNGLVADGFNYRLIRTVAKFHDIYSRQSLPHDQCHQNSWELVSQRLDETVKCCFTQWVRLRKYYIDSLISKFSSDPVSAKPTTKFEFRMKFLYPEVKDLIPYSRENFYDSTDIDIGVAGNGEENPNNNNAAIYDPSLSTSSSDVKIPRIIIPIPKIQTKYTTEFKRKFIDKVEGFPTLYSLISWENSRQKYLWAKFTNIDNVKIPAQECCNLWISLKNTYISIIRKIYPYKKCNKFVINWEFYNDMKFLWPYFKDKDAKLVEVIVRPSLNETIKSESVIYEEIFNIYNSEQEAVIKFIELVKKYPVLYMNKKFDQVTPTGKLKLQTWDYLAKYTPWLAKECQELWLLLYKQYVLYLNDHKSTFQGMIYKDAMSFLKNFIEEDGLILNETTNYFSDSPVLIKNQNDTLLENLETVPIVKFLQSVKKFKILYDNTDLSISSKDKLWSAVSRDMQISPKICAEKWAELREKYISIQSKTSLSEEDVFYSTYMAFLKPYLIKPVDGATLMPPSSQDTLNIYESMSSEYKFEMAKNIILEVKNYPRIYLRLPSNKGSLPDFEKIGKKLNIPSSICEKVFRNAEQNYLERSVDRVLNPSLDPYILEKELEYIKPEVDKKVNRWLISNGNRLLSIVKQYPELHSYNSKEFRKSTLWKTIAKEMFWRISSCIKLWEIIISGYKELKENGVSESNWVFKKAFQFLEKTDSCHESVDDTVWNLTLDYFNTTLIHEIKKYPCLYDPAIKVLNKDVIWKNIAVTLSSTLEDTKKQWKRLKDIFVAVMHNKFEGPIDNMQQLLNELSFLKPIFGSKKEDTKSNEKEVKEKKLNKKKEINKCERKNGKLTKQETTEENVPNSVTMPEIGAENIIMLNDQVDNTPRMMDCQIIGENGLNDNIEGANAEVFTDTITRSEPTRYEYFTITKLYSDSEESDLEIENPKVEVISVDDDNDYSGDGCSDTAKRKYEEPNVPSVPDIVKKHKI